MVVTIQKRGEMEINNLWRNLMDEKRKTSDSIINISLIYFIGVAHGFLNS